MVDNNQLYPIAVMIDELKSDDQKKRIASIRSLTTIAIALGQERTRNELLPYILDLMDDEEEVLLALAETLGAFVDYVGGPAHAMHVLKALEKLCQIEETVVREKATESIKRILTQIKIKDQDQQILEMIKRLMNGEGFTSKFTATHLIPIVFTQVSPGLQGELLGLFVQVCQDEIPQVRKQSAITLNEMVKLIPKAPEQELLNIFSKFFKDEQDSVRMQGVDTCVAFAKVLGPQKSQAQLMGYIKKFAEDKSWRIRYLVADRISDLGHALGKDLSRENLLPYFCSFLQDSESEVRTAACSRLAEFCQLLEGPVLLQKIVPTLPKLQQDQFQYVRSALSENLLGLCPKLDKAATNEHILPLFLALLKDENSDVRLNLFKRLEDLHKAIGIENLTQSILPALTELSQDKNWRVKLTVVELFPTLGKQLGEQYFNDKLAPICISWLNDSIFQIREQTLKILKELTVLFGPQWASARILPKLMSLHIEQNYLHRLTPLFGIAALGPVLTPDVIRKHCLPVLATLSQDRIANIRLNVAKSLQTLLPVVKGQADLEEKFKGMLMQLGQDQDQDVVYYARHAQRTG